MYARPQLGDRPALFGVSGRLWRQALVLYDRPTRSLWSQVTHQAIAGPHRGRRLETIPSEITDWKTWHRRHPGSTAMVRPRESLAGTSWAALLSVCVLLMLLAALGVRRRGQRGR